MTPIVSTFNDEIPALDVAQFPQPLENSVPETRLCPRRTTPKLADPIDLRGRLRFGPRSRDDETACNSADEFAPIHHRIALSACSISGVPFNRTA